jgi:hypothetical protein
VSDFRPENLTVLALMILLALLPSLASSIQTPVGTVPPAQGTFIAHWSVEGKQEKLEFAGVDSFAIFQHTGMITVARTNGFVGNVLSKCIGLRDGRQGVVSRCVWLSASGDKIFSELRRRSNGLHLRGGKGQGRFVGGTGRYKGITGSYEMSWVDEWDDTPESIKGKTLSMTGEWEMMPFQDDAEK